MAARLRDGDGDDDGDGKGAEASRQTPGSTGGAGVSSRARPRLRDSECESERNSERTGERDRERERGDTAATAASRRRGDMRRDTVATSRSLSTSKHAAMINDHGESRLSLARDAVQPVSDFDIDIEMSAPTRPLTSSSSSAAPQRAAALAAVVAAALRTASAQHLGRALFVVYAFIVFVLACVAVSRLNDAHLAASERCDDGNECTLDLERSEACFWAPRVDGTPCTSACYGAPSRRTVAGPALTPPTLGNGGGGGGAATTCQRGVCTAPAGCVGECARGADCPAITVSDNVKHAACSWQTCVYSEQTQMPVTASECSGALFRAMCASLLGADDPLTPCLDVASLCENGQLVCIYSFACARPARD